jgi:GT2 family glycosyltransferase
MTLISTNTQYDVAVILVNYNSGNYTIECVRSILEQTRGALSYGIIIIDNASEIEDYNNLKNGLLEFEKKAPLLLFRSKINTGFSAGNMLGLQFITARYYFLLNNDCRLQNDCLNILYNFCEKRPDVALCSPQLYDDNGKHHPCFDYFPYLSTKIFGLGILRLTYGKRYIKRKHIYTEPVQVDVVSGSQMFVRASAFNAAGGLDTTFFLYCEEEDIAIRLANNKYQAYLVPDARNTHKGGASTVPSLGIRKEFYISFLYFYRKHFGFTRQQILKLILIIRLLRKSLFDIDNFKLAIFIASGANTKHSLRHKQQIQNILDI